VIGIVEVEDNLVSLVTEVRSLHRVEQVAATPIRGDAIGVVAEGEEDPTAVSIQPQDLECGVTA
jgi:hypothetical protein